MFDTYYVATHKFPSFTAVLSPLYCLDKGHILFFVLIRHNVIIMKAEGEERKTKMWSATGSADLEKIGGGYTVRMSASYLID